MADSIKEIISTLQPDDIKDFRRFVASGKGKEGRKDLQLFDLLVEGVDGDTLKHSIYPDGNADAYLALRKRLTRQLTRFIALKLLDNDSSNTSQVLNLVNMARYLFGHGLKLQGRKYLKKAKKQALNNDLYEILNAIYVMEIQHLPPQEIAERQELIDSWKNNKLLMQENELGEIALSLVSDRIVKASKQGQYKDLGKLIDESLAQLDLGKDFLLKPRFVYNLTSINRRRMLLEKDYFNLEPFLINQYEAIEKNGGFKSKKSYYKSGFLYMIAHILFRNRKFEQAMDYLEQLEAVLQGAPKVQVNEFAHKAQLLKANLLILTNRREEAVGLLENMLSAKNLSAKDKLNAIINLGITYHYLGKHDEAHGTLLRINHSDKWCEKVMGAEWVMKKNLMEVILFMELEEFSLVDSRIRHIRFSFRKMLEEPRYQRVSKYLSFLQKISYQPQGAEFDKMEESIEKSFEWIPIEYEDLQAMAFYAWLKSKLTRQKHYDVLLQLIHEND